MIIETKYHPATNDSEAKVSAYGAFGKVTIPVDPKTDVFVSCDKVVSTYCDKYYSRSFYSNAIKFIKSVSLTGDGYIYISDDINSYRCKL